MKKLNLILVLMLGVALALACSGGSDKNTTSTNATDKKEQPANTDKTKSSDSAQDANVFTHKEGGIKFEVPNGWKATPDGDNMTVSSADGGLQVVFWVPAENSFDAAVKDLDKEVSKTIKNVKTVGKPTQDVHNGMPHYGESGTGDVNGNTIVWSVDVLSAKKPVIILRGAKPLREELSRLREAHQQHQENQLETADFAQYGPALIKAGPDFFLDRSKQHRLACAVVSISAGVGFSTCLSISICKRHKRNEFWLSPASCVR